MTIKSTFLIDSLGGGGAEAVCVTLANGLVERGWQVDLLVLSLRDAAYLDRVRADLNLLDFKVEQPRLSGLKMLNFIFKARPKMIVVFSPDLAVVLMILKTLFRFKTKIIVRNINTMSRVLKSKKGFYQAVIVKNLFKVFFHKADHIINQCAEMEEDLLKVYPQLTSRSSVIYNPVNPGFELIAKEERCVDKESRPYLLCVGRLDEQKAFHLAIQAFQIIADRQPGLRLKILGQGVLESTLKAEAKKLGVADRVDFEGFQKDVAPFYLGAKATVLSSLYEGFPNVLIESITLGTPIVAFDCPSGPRESIIEGVNGFLVESQNVKALAAALEKVLITSFSERQIKETAKRFNSEAMIDQYSAFLRAF